MHSAAPFQLADWLPLSHFLGSNRLIRPNSPKNTLLNIV
jgi:hypothetical protein